MVKLKKYQLAAILTLSGLSLSGCGDEGNKDLIKYGVIAAGAGGGALLGDAVAPGMVGSIAGGVLGGVAGALVAPMLTGE
jgi:hypothetical protein